MLGFKIAALFIIIYALFFLSIPTWNNKNSEPHALLVGTVTVVCALAMSLGVIGGLLGQ